MQNDFRDWMRLAEAVVDDDRLARAASMGFDTTRVWYHGTTGKDIEAFDPAKLGHNTGAKSAGKGFFFASDPKVAVSYGRHESYMPDASRPHYERAEAEVAQMEQEKQKLIDLLNVRASEEGELRHQFYHAPKKQRISGEAYWAGLDAINQKYNTPEYQAANARYMELFKQINDLKARMKGMQTMSAISRAVVFPVYLKMRNPMYYDMKGDTYREVSYNDILIKARRGRRDGTIIQNTYDPGYRGANAPMCDIAVVFTPQQVRSVHASFDLEKADSADLMV